MLSRLPPTVLLAAALAASGCGNLVSRLPDAGADAGLEDAGQDDGGLDGGGSDGGADAGTDAGFDAGVPDAGPAVYRGDGGALAFVQVVHPNRKLYAAVHGNAAAVYVGGSEGTILTCTTGATPSCAVAVQNTNAGLVNGLWASANGRVFASAESGFFDCLGNCQSPASWRYFGVTQHQPAGVCGLSDSEVYGVSTDLSVAQPQGAVWKFVNPGWTYAAPVPGVSFVHGCTLAAGALFLAANEHVGRYTLPAGPAGVELVDYTGFGTSGASMRWFAAHAALETVHVGGESKWLAVRQADAGWVLANQPPNFGAGLGALRTLAGRFPQELFASGDLVQAGRQTLKRVGDGGWDFVADLSDMDVYGLWAQTDDVYWAVGVDNPAGTGTGVVFRARR